MKSNYMNREGLVTLSYEEANLVRQALVLQADTLRAAIELTARDTLVATLSEHEMWHNMLERNERLYNLMTNAEVKHDAYREEMESGPTLDEIIGALSELRRAEMDRAYDGEVEAQQFIDLAEWERTYDGE